MELARQTTAAPRRSIRGFKMNGAVDKMNGERGQ